MYYHLVTTTTSVRSIDRVELASTACAYLPLYSKVTQFIPQVLTPPSKADPDPDHWP